MKLLVIEDNVDQQNAYRDNVVSLNTADPEGVQIEVSVVPSLEEGLAAIETHSFDAAIVDLKLSEAEGEAEGNEIIKQIVNKKRFPVFVYSGFLGDLDPSLTESVFFKTYEKPASLQDLLSELKTIYQTGVTKILGRGGLIDSFLGKIFWEHIAASFDELKQKGIDERHLLRYIASHLREYLGLNEAGAPDKHYSEEVYIKPNIKPDFFTGSLIKRKNTEEFSIILTPQCDMAHPNANAPILAAKIHGGPMTGFVRDYKRPDPDPATTSEADMQKHGERKEKAEKTLERIVRNNFSQKHYFLPKHQEFPGGLIHFQDLFPIDRATIADEFDHVATISDSFLKDVIARFAFYYSRQGAPDLKIEVADL